jgi:sigma-54 dependent transcriptional regulator, acetoin dehydrogenase operon transcriptional activator AcoR
MRGQAAALSREVMPLLITGEAGAGKLTLAKAIAGADAERVLLDAARTTIDGEDALLRQLASVADSPGKTIILRRVGCLSDRAIQTLIAIANNAEANNSRVIATTTTAVDPDRSGAGGLAESFGLKLEVPPLRERADDLLDLVPHLIARRGATARMAPAAIQTLMRYDWPGNVRELDGLVRLLLTRKRTTDIVLADLPPAYQRGSRRLRRIEQVERSAIVQALLEVDGNRTKAAELLEIGRATLYRKIRAYGLDLDVSTS